MIHHPAQLPLLVTLAVHHSIIGPLDMFLLATSAPPLLFIDTLLGAYAIHIVCSRGYWGGVIITGGCDDCWCKQG